jgi:hypothetical protein
MGRVFLRRPDERTESRLGLPQGNGWNECDALGKTACRRAGRSVVGERPQNQKLIAASSSVICAVTGSVTGSVA